jgi:hypothetical protein
VIGCTIRPVIAARDRSLEELIYDTAQLALADAGITIEDIDGIVVASNDQFDGRSISVMMASGSVGGVDRDIMSTPSASEHAFILGALRVATGQFRTNWWCLGVQPRSRRCRRRSDLARIHTSTARCHSMNCRRMRCRHRPSSVRNRMPAPRQRPWPRRTGRTDSPHGRIRRFVLHLGRCDGR